ncbi:MULTISPECIES: YjzD family protein [Exiguobacterium]|uniref:YjzD family protein n=1 Tax=Exiguobacterium TaxID=33986 RepID=UPI001BEA2351|nr:MULTISPECIES: YjzD family protein [Exiguobacterium]MCT4775873.1 YjzD family protein [Exiguobacterium aquaticum]MCT4789798.1 YjzD family protein [Exiguobacterium mexicanum]
MRYLVTLFWAILLSNTAIFIISAVDGVPFNAMLATFFGVVITIFIVLLDTLNQDMGISDVAQEK